MQHSSGFAPPILRPRRVHDAVGASARVFATIRAAQTKGPVIWVESGHAPGHLYPPGLAAFFDPSRLIAVNARTQKEALWCMEEALRETPSLVIADLRGPADLMESRRLQLAAEAGESTGLCLAPDTPVNNAAETRWRSTPLVTPEETTLHRWELIKNKKGILGTWDISWDGSTHTLLVVSAPGGRTDVAQRRDDRLGAPLRSGRDVEKRLAALLDQRGGGEGRPDRRIHADGHAGDLS